MKRRKGFTLIELVITIMIIGVLAAIAYPKYMQMVYKANRAEAKTWLNDSAQQLQRCFTAYGKYNDADLCKAYKQLSVDGVTSKDRGFYLIKVNKATATATFYELEATAVLAPQTADKTPNCISIKLNSKGEKTPAECW